MVRPATAGPVRPPVPGRGRPVGPGRPTVRRADRSQIADVEPIQPLRALPIGIACAMTPWPGGECDVVDHVRWGNSKTSWKSAPIRRSSGGTNTPAAGSSSTPSPSSTCPSSRGITPANAHTAVDLPAPLGPSRATVVPGSARRRHRGRTRTGDPRPDRACRPLMSPSTIGCAAPPARRGTRPPTPG